MKKPTVYFWLNENFFTRWNFVFYQNAETNQSALEPPHDFGQRPELQAQSYKTALNKTGLFPQINGADFQIAVILLVGKVFYIAA